MATERIFSSETAGSGGASIEAADAGESLVRGREEGRGPACPLPVTAPSATMDLCDILRDPGDGKPWVFSEPVLLAACSPSLRTRPGAMDRSPRFACCTNASTW